MDETNLPAEETPVVSTQKPPEDLGDVLRANIISDALDPEQGGQDKERRERLGLPTTEGQPVSMMIELNLMFPTGLNEARRALREMMNELMSRNDLEEIGDLYMRCTLTLAEARALAGKDGNAAVERAGKAEKDRAERDAKSAPQSRKTTKPAAPEPRRYQTIYRIWPDFIVRRQVDLSAATIKADAARRSFDATGDGIAWAVIDSGVWGDHPHFDTFDNLRGDVADLHYDFTLPEIPESLTGEEREAEIKKRRDGALVDDLGHGTHVAGIIAGALIRPFDGAAGEVPIRPEDVAVVRGVQESAAKVTGTSGLEERRVSDLTRLSGIAPRTRIVSLKALTGGGDTSSNVMRALHYVRQTINGNGKIMRVHGVNLSLGYEFDPKWFACGQSPICVEVDRLVRSGVVVVVAAGNTGYGRLSSMSGQTGAGLTLTINDPGNAALAITVGATHRESPHTYGVSYFSSKGPTGDGRLKPDIVAPGERITSCAAGENLKKISKLKASDKIIGYIEDSGTSMAAPHVSGAVAAFLSIRREFIGKPEEIKRIFLETATSLGRERYFEGHGLVDLMRAIQSV